MAPRKVTVFGGTGFLGQRVVQRLLERDFSVRVAVRHPERIAALFPALHLDAIQADVNDDRSVAAAVAGVEGVVNAVSLYAESGPQTFHSVHVEAATQVARLAREAGVGRLRDDHLAAATVLDGDAAQRQRPALDRSDLAGARDPDNDGLPHSKMLNLICLKI
ncbi:MAG TPA: NAD(P)H-binding protein [Roseiarcus sp.]|jgi:uncharacterized protein YbjT (DUF2867 family)